MNIKHHVGSRFGRLTAVNRVGEYYQCICACGNTRTVRTDRLVAGITKSCGCISREIKNNMHAEAEKRKQEVRVRKKRERKEIAKENKKKISREETKLRAVWSAMMQRCYNANNKNYKSYGGRGIDVELRWHDRKNFLEDMLPLYRNGAWLERIDNHRGYCVDNCEFATARKQASNRRTSLLIWNTKRGIEEALTARCKLHKVKYSAGYKWFSSIRANRGVPTLIEFLNRFVYDTPV